MTYFIPELNLNANSVTLVLSGSAGQAAIPDVAQRIGLFTLYATGSFLVGLQPIQSASTVTTGSVLSDNFRTGFPINANAWNWFDIGSGVNRVLYFSISGSSTARVTIAYT